MQSTAWSITTCSWWMIIDLYQLRLVCNISSLEGQNGNWDLSRSLCNGRAMESLSESDLTVKFKWKTTCFQSLIFIWKV